MWEREKKKEKKKRCVSPVEKSYCVTLPYIGSVSIQSQPKINVDFDFFFFSFFSTDKGKKKRNFANNNT